MRSLSRALAAPTLLAVLLVPVAGCTRNLLDNEIASHYERSAQYHGPDRNPVIVIPGLTGTRLVSSETGQVVWGAFSGDFARPDEEGLPLLALPMAPGRRLSELRDEVVPDGVVDRLRVRLLGLPFELEAYFQILSALGAGGYRDESLGIASEIDYGDDHYTCFQLPYDWRRDNVETARQIHRFIEEKAAYVREETLRRFGSAPEPVRFDVVAHSMGALALRYYLRYGDAELPDEGPIPEPTWAGAERVERVILVAPPNSGAVEAVRYLVDGRNYGPFLPHYPDVLLGTYPSFYQVLPRERHGFVTDVEGVSLDLFDLATWERFGWGLGGADGPGLERLLPDVGDPAERVRIARDHLAKSLLRARRFVEALDRPAEPPPHLQVIAVIGDAVPTAERASVDASGHLRITAEAPGDGTVLRTSALGDERVGGDWSPALVSPIAWDRTLFLFQDHLGLTKDPEFTDNLLFWLLEEPRRRGR